MLVSSTSMTQSSSVIVGPDPTISARCLVLKHEDDEVE